MKKTLHIIQNLVIYAGISAITGNIIATAFDYHYWFFPKNILENSIYSIFIGLVLAKGNELILYLINKKYKWLENAGKIVLWGIIFTSLFSTIAIIVVNYLWYVKFMGNSFEDFQIITKRIALSIIFSIILISVVSHALIFFKNWKASLVNAEKLKREQLALQYESLKNQVSPHFLFNSLNVLISLIHKDSAKANAFIDQLSQVFHYVLDQKDKELVPLQAELDFVKNYIALQKIRFENSLNIEVNISPSENLYLLPLSMQMLVENAIKHNVVSENKPLQINISKKNDYIVVSNNLQKKNSRLSSSKIGLSNIKSRYEFLTHKPFIIEKSEEHFIVKLPLLNK
jgi:hypothetical protein